MQPHRLPRNLFAGLATITHSPRGLLCVRKSRAIRNEHEGPPRRSLFGLSSECRPDRARCFASTISPRSAGDPAENEEHTHTASPNLDRAKDDEVSPSGDMTRRFATAETCRVLLLPPLIPLSFISPLLLSSRSNVRKRLIAQVDKVLQSVVASRGRHMDSR